jgi:DNA repair exonuclease SbcCD ATPase subunit
MDDVANRHTEDQAKVEITYIGIDGNFYEVCRTRRPASLTFWVSPDVTTKMGEITGKDAKETQDRINQSLGRDFRTFSQCELFGQGRASNFLSLPPSEQKAVLESILPFAELDVWCERVKGHLADTTSVISDRESEVSGCRRELKALIGQLDEVKSADVGWLNSITNQRVELLGHLKRERKKSASMSLEELEAHTVGVQEKFNEAVGIKRQWENEVVKWRSVPIPPIAGEVCPTCGSIVSLETRATSTQTDPTAKVLEAELGLEEAQKYHDLCKQQLDSCNEMEKAVSRESIYQKQIDELATESPFGAQRERLTVRITELQAEECVISEHLEKLKAEQGHLIFWREMFSKDLKLMFVEDAAPYLQKRINHHLQELGNPQIHAEVSTTKALVKGTKHEIDIKILSDTGGEGYDSLSGGERQMASFAAGLGLADLASTQSIGESSFLILDEPFSQLDARNSEAIVSYLTGDLSKERSTILLVSNDDTLMSLVPNRVHVVKEKGVSKIS